MSGGKAIAFDTAEKIELWDKLRGPVFAFGFPGDRVAGSRVRYPLPDSCVATGRNTCEALAS